MFNTLDRFSEWIEKNRMGFITTPHRQNIVRFIQSEKELSEKEGEANMKQRVQWLLDNNDDYMHFIEQFKQL